MNSVEDTKGNNGERGELLITNLRVIWVSSRTRKTNLSIGYNCVVSLSIKSANSRLRGNTQALFVLTKANGSRFEFIFTNLVRNSPRIFTTIQAVYRAYETTKLYRDLKLRGAIIRDGTLNLLPQEQVFKHVNGVWNLSSDQGNLGTFYITNVRLVWHANLAENFNVSIPYLQMKTIRMRESKFGRALVLETVQRSGGYILGFRVDPQDKLEGVFQEIKSLHQVYSVTPLFGIEFVVEETQKSLEEVTVKRAMEDVEIGKRPPSSLLHVCPQSSKIAPPLPLLPFYPVSCDHQCLMIWAMSLPPRPPSSPPPPLSSSPHCGALTCLLPWDASMGCFHASMTIIISLNCVPAPEDEGRTEAAGDAFAAYIADGGGGAEGNDRPPVFSKELGLCIETLKPGYTIENLWNAV